MQRRQKPFKQNCNKVQVACTTDVDCELQCNIMPQLSDPSKFISYTCGEDTGYDEGNKFNGETYGFAVDDYEFLQKLSKRDK